ncbi:MAG: lipocalin-like domain-containing protein [Pseudomonadota bacterium]
MKFRSGFLIAAFLTAVPFSQSFAQQSKLLGAWTIVSVNDERTDGSKAPLYGANPQGFLIFDSAGRYSLQLCAAERPKFAANDRTKGTPDEYKAAVQGCNPHWGHYTVDEAGKTINFKIEHAMFANWEGTEQKRSFSIESDTLRYTVPISPVGGTNPVVVWKRAP